MYLRDHVTQFPPLDKDGEKQRSNDSLNTSVLFGDRARTRTQASQLPASILPLPGASSAYTFLHVLKSHKVSNSGGKKKNKTAQHLLVQSLYKIIMAEVLKTSFFFLFAKEIPGELWIPIPLPPPLHQSMMRIIHVYYSGQCKTKISMLNLPGKMTQR